MTSSTSRIAQLDELCAAAKAVVWFDWSDNDADAVAAVERLRQAAAALESRTLEGDMPKSIADGSCAPRPDSESPGSTSPPTLADGKRDFAGGRETGIQPAAREWVPVGERLPPRQKMVLMHIPDSHRGPVSYGFCEALTDRWMGLMAVPNLWNPYEGQDRVTHWMPLPLPPAADK